MKVTTEFLNKTETLKNKTFAFLAPQLKLLGKEFTDRFNSFFKIALGIGTRMSIETGIWKPKISIIHRKDYFLKQVNQFIEYCKEIGILLNHYPLDSKQLIWLTELTFDEESVLYSRIVRFIKGEYDLMVDSEDEAEWLYSGKQYSKDILYAFDVITGVKDDFVIERYMKDVERVFGVELSRYDVVQTMTMNGTLAIPPIAEDELFGVESSVTVKDYLKDHGYTL